MFDRTRNPTESDFIAFIANSNAVKAWNELSDYITSNYELDKEILYYGNKYGWLVRYRRSKQTIVSLFPEKLSFSFLIVYGKKEIDRFLTRQSEFQAPIIEVFENTEKLHDGKWLWIQVVDSSLLEDLKKLITIKRRPKKRS